MDYFKLQRQIDSIECSDIKFYHYDVVDGRFNNCFVLGETLLNQMKPHITLPVEVHLAVFEPERYIESFALAGGDYIAVHYEAMKKPLDVFNQIKALGKTPILAYKASTPPGDDFTELASYCPWILKLTVNPGFSGQRLQTKALEHIYMMHNLLNHANLTTRIQADGNVNKKTIPLLASAGASIFTGGSSGLFLPGASIQTNANELLKAAMINKQQTTSDN